MDYEAASELLRYDPETGHLYRMKDVLCGPNRFVRFKAGERAGAQMVNGYISVTINGKMYYAHRLAWLLMTGEWPEKSVDHINGVRNDNRWANLRSATNQQNQFNRGVRKDSSSGIKGVSFHKASGLWWAGIRINGKCISLKYHKTAEAAKAAYEEAAAHYHGEFARSNNG